MINEVYAYLASDDEGETLPAFLRDGIMMPMVCTDVRHVDGTLRAKAREIATASGRRLTLVRFSVRELIEVIEP